MAHLPTGRIVSSPQIDTVNVYACTVIGYLVYTLAQVFLFCFFGNRLIEEVMFFFMRSLKLFGSLHRARFCSSKAINVAKDGCVNVKTEDKLCLQNNLYCCTMHLDVNVYVYHLMHIFISLREH